MTDRKQYPLVSGCLDYFPDALLEVAHVSFVATQQHHPGEPMHWDRSKSDDEPDALGRHLLARGTRDTDGQRHSAKVAWRALAMLQKEIEAERVQESAPFIVNKQPEILNAPEPEPVCVGQCGYILTGKMGV